MDRWADKIKWDGNGLIPAVVQDADTGQVLMVAWMSAESLRLTLETGETHFWSRSRNEIWHKGATSGNTQAVVGIWVDCDGDTLLIKVNPAGPACHTGETSCFFSTLEANLTDILMQIFATIQDRKNNPRPGSYTNRLFEAGEDEIAKKIGEEAVEVLLAAKAQGDDRVISEMADLFYHCLVLLAHRGLSPADVADELVRRHRPG